MMTTIHPTLTFAVGWNTPGYLSDGEPIECETFDDAKRCLIDELLHDADNASTERKAEDLAAMAEDVNLWSSPDWIETTEHDCLSVRYWIEFAS